MVVFCYVTVDGRYVSASDPHVVTVHVRTLEPLVSTGGVHRGDAYLRRAPLESFLDDPLAAPAPLGTLWREGNNVPGLQPQPFHCANWWEGFAPARWVGPHNIVAKAPDLRLA